MKKTIILLATLILLALCGCKTQPKIYNSIDYSMYDTEDFHVNFAVGLDSCYSDGSYQSNQMFDDWVEDYEESHY